MAWGVESAVSSSRGTWEELADLALAGEVISREQANGVLHCGDAELLALLAAAYRVRRHHWANTVQLYYLRNAKSGLCPEDCKYCSQSKISDAPIPKYTWQSEEKLLEGALAAKATGARTYCIVASGRGPSNREVAHVVKAVERIKAETGLHICCCLGLLKPEQAEQLKAAGVDRVNHNLNTSRRFHEEIVTTHTYDDRLNTLENCRSAGLELCAGMIVGMGETSDDILDVAFELRRLEVESIPVNFLHPIEGTPLGPRAEVQSREQASAPFSSAPSSSVQSSGAPSSSALPANTASASAPGHIDESAALGHGLAGAQVAALNPRYCLKTLCLMRFVNPAAEIRIAGGREVNLRSLQPLGLYPANSIFVSDYLTTPGQPASDDYRMLEDLGFDIVQA